MSTRTLTRVVLACAALLAPSIASAQKPEVSAVPPGAQRCADDHGTCTLPSDWPGGKIYYGAGTRFIEISVEASAKPFVCLPQTFGIADPVPNVKKTCYVAPAFAMVATLPKGAQSCADDFGTCTPPANWASSSGGKLYYGAGNRFVEIPRGAATKPFTCLPQTFGIADPVPNVKKTCYLLAGPAVQRSPVALPNVGGPSNLQIVTEPSKAPVVVVFPTLMTEAQRTEYSRWTDAQREELLQAYQRLTQDWRRTYFLADRFAPTATAYRPHPSTPSMSAVPAGYEMCGAAGQVCAHGGVVLFGAGNKFAVASGVGAFTCAARGTVKTPSIATPADLAVEDPLPGAAKACYSPTPAEPVRAVPDDRPKPTPRPMLTCKAGDVSSETGVCEGAATCPAPSAFITGSSTAVDELARRSFCGKSMVAQVPCPVAPAGLNAVTWDRAQCRHAPNCGTQTFDAGSNLCKSSQSTGDKVLSGLTNKLAGDAAPSTKPGCYDGFGYNANTKLCEKAATPSCPEGYLAVRVKAPASSYPDSCIQINDPLVRCTDAHYLAQPNVRSHYFGGGKTTCSYALPGYGSGF